MKGLASRLLWWWHKLLPQKGTPAVKAGARRAQPRTMLASTSIVGPSAAILPRDHQTAWSIKHRRSARRLTKARARPMCSGRHPDCGEAIVAQQVEDVQSVAPISLGLAHDHGANLRGIADEQRVPEALHEV